LRGLTSGLRQRQGWYHCHSGRKGSKKARPKMTCHSCKIET